MYPVPESPFTDIRFRAGRDEMKCHRIVLLFSDSQWLRTVVANSGKKPIHIPDDMNWSAFEFAIRCFYRQFSIGINRLRVSEDLLFEFWKTARYMDSKLLLTIANDELCTYFRSVTDDKQKAEFIDVDKLLELCIHYCTYPVYSDSVRYMTSYIQTINSRFWEYVRNKQLDLNILHALVVLIGKEPENLFDDTDPFQFVNCRVCLVAQNEEADQMNVTCILFGRVVIISTPDMSINVSGVSYLMPIGEEGWCHLNKRSIRLKKIGKWWVVVGGSKYIDNVQQIVNILITGKKKHDFNDKELSEKVGGLDLYTVKFLSNMCSDHSVWGSDQEQKLLRLHEMWVVHNPDQLYNLYCVGRPPIAFTRFKIPPSIPVSFKGNDDVLEVFKMTKGLCNPRDIFEMNKCSWFLYPPVVNTTYKGHILFMHDSCNRCIVSYCDGDIHTSVPVNNVAYDPEKLTYIWYLNKLNNEQRNIEPVKSLP